MDPCNLRNPSASKLFVEAIQIPCHTELTEALKVKDPSAFEMLIAEHGAMMYRTASRIVGRNDAEDVLQETLLKVYEQIHTFNGHAALATWLYRIVVNTALMRLRTRGRSREEPTDPMDPQFTKAGEFKREVTDWGLSPEDTLLRHEALVVLREGIKRLPETYREAYCLAEIDGQPHQEVATILEINVGAVKTRIHRARLFLRETIENYFAERGKKHRR